MRSTRRKHVDADDELQGTTAQNNSNDHDRAIEAAADAASEMISAAFAARGELPKVLAPKKRGRARVVHLIDEDGNTIDRVTHGKLLEGLLAREGIAVQVRDGTRPKAIACLDCGTIVKVRAKGKIPLRCEEDRKRKNMEWTRKYREANTEERLESQRKTARKYREANTEKVREAERERMRKWRARKKAEREAKKE
jgi:hypothetical protein